MKISLLKSIDRLVGVVVTTCLPAAPLRLLPNPRLFLLIRPGGIGDAVLLVPTINMLLKLYPGCSIDILAERRNASAFHLVTGIRTVYLYDTLAGLSSSLRNRYDVVIDTEQWYRLSAVIARLVRAPVKIGFGTNERRRMFTHIIRYDTDAYESDNFLALLNPLEADSQWDRSSVSMDLPLHSVAKADQLLQPLCSASFVVIFPGASIPEKRWGIERFRHVSKRLSEDGYKVVVVGGREERSDGDEIAGDTGLNLAGMTTLPETAAVIARSTLVICGDSGVLHIAAGLNIPTVSLFGPSSVNKWAPKGEKHVVINHHLPCSPCSRFGTIPPCPIGARCISDISTDEVMEAIGWLLSQPPE